MKAHTMDEAIDRIPPGRARSRYQRIAADLGGSVYTIDMESAPCTLWLVPDQSAASGLKGLGIPRWRVWTLVELQDLFGSFGQSVETLDEALRLWLSHPPPEEERID